MVLNQFIILISCLVIVTIAVPPQPDYYWRDFNGTIPSDAVLGQLFPGDSYITVTGRPVEVQKTDKYVKILCSQHPELFQWYPATSDTFESSPFHVVPGGWEVKPSIGVFDGIIYIGRVLHNNAMVIGKVIGYNPGSGSGRGWLYYYNGREEQIATEYEILLYDIPK